MTTGITKVRNSIIKWRREQGKLRDVPIELRSEAVQLLESHSWAEVSKQLGISKATLSGWRKSTRGQSITPHVPEAISDAPGGESPQRYSGDVSRFVECIVDVPAAVERAALTVRLEMPDGVNLHVDGPMDGYFVQGLVQVVCEARGR